jgi:hypothetical protein
MGTGRLGDPNILGDLVVPELLAGLPTGRCGIQKDRGRAQWTDIFSLCREGASVHRKLGVSVETWPRNRAFFSLEAHLGEPGGGSHSRDPEG